jgi:hypothetical protein
LKLNQLHFQINHLIRDHYPNLYVKWKNFDLNAEVLFSSYVISLFTSFMFDNQSFLLDFWDIILIVR